MFGVVIVRGPSVRYEAVVEGSLEASVKQRLFIFVFHLYPRHVSDKKSTDCIEAHIYPKAGCVITAAAELIRNIKICSQSHGKAEGPVQHITHLSLRSLLRPVFK